MWTDVGLRKPDPLEEVLVLVDGHRGPSWRNNYPLVAYMGEDGKWHEERHPSQEPLSGVICWKPIDFPLSNETYET